jgi:hypothetical protein
MTTRFEVHNTEEEREREGLGIQLVRQKLVDGVWTDAPNKKGRRSVSILSPDCICAKVDAETRYIVEEATDVNPYPRCCIERH